MNILILVLEWGSKSEVQDLDCNVPQGSVLGPGFFGDYCALVIDIFKKQCINYHLYADDTQVYVPFHLKRKLRFLSNPLGAYRK